MAFQCLFCAFTVVVDVLLHYKGEMINLTLMKKAIFYYRQGVFRPICLPLFTPRLLQTRA
jgi:hypothetical protein